MSPTPSPWIEKGRQLWQQLIEKITDNKRLAIGILVIAAVVAGVTAAAKSSEKFSRFLASVSGGGPNGNVSGRVRETKGLASQSELFPHRDCAFETSQKPDTGKVLFKEIAWMGDKQSPNNEWLALEKVGAGDFDISGYQILNENQKIKITLPAKSILNDSKPLYFLARKNGIAGVKADLTYSGALRNANEGLRLFDGQCRLLDEVLAHPAWPAGSNAFKQTVKRDLITLKWFDSSHPLPDKAKSQTASASRAAAANTANSMAPSPETLLIGLITVGIKGNSNDSFIELYNPGSAPVNLTGWSVKKKNSTGAESTLISASRLSGKIVPAAKYFLLADQTGYIGTVSPDVVWPSSYQLAYKNNAVTVYNKNGRALDTAAWSELAEGKSLARVSWESNRFVVQDAQSPKNSLSN